MVSYLLQIVLSVSVGDSLAARRPGIHTTNAIIRWCDKTIEILEKLDTGPASDFRV